MKLGTFPTKLGAKILQGTDFSAVETSISSYIVSKSIPELCGLYLVYTIYLVYTYLLGLYFK